MLFSSTAEQSDEALIRLTLERGSQYFGKIVKRHSDYLYGLGMRLSNGNDAIAKDMSQQAFVNAFKYLASFNPTHSGLGADRTKRFRNWLTGIAVNCYSDLLKTESKYTGLENDQLSNLEQQGADHSRDNLDEFSAMIQPLPILERQLITLRFVYEYNIDEIAGMLSLKSGTVKSKISRAVARLREITPTDNSQNNDYANGNENDDTKQQARSQSRGAAQ